MFKQFNPKNLILAALVLVLIATGCAAPTGYSSCTSHSRSGYCCSGHCCSSHTFHPPPLLRLPPKSTCGPIMVTLDQLQLV